MTLAVGIDTSRRLSDPSPNNPAITVWDDYVAHLGRAPAWVCRYFGATNLTPLDAQEAAWVLARGARVLPLWQGSALNGASPPAATYALGASEAAIAIAGAQDIGAPGGVRVLTDLEQQSATAEYVLGYADTMAASPYRGGLYGIITPGMPLASALAGALVQDSSGTVADLWLWSSRLVYALPAGAAMPALPAWAPGTVAPLAAQTQLWQTAEDVWGDLGDLDLAQPAALAGMWGAPGVAGVSLSVLLGVGAAVGLVGVVAAAELGLL